MKKIILILFCFAFIACSNSKQQTPENVPCQEGINLMPMYGGVPKCEQQLASDKGFLATCDEQFASRQEAVMSYVETGWKYLHQKDFDTAMKRFNQAWLLDDKSPVVYYSFGYLLAKKGDFGDAASFYKKALDMNGEDQELLMPIADGYKNLYENSKDKKYKSKTIELLTKMIKSGHSKKEAEEMLKAIENI